MNGHEWEDIWPSKVIRCLKAIPANILSSLGMREIYKYPAWHKMTCDQRNRAIAWFRQLPEEV
jgi:hypothetical protein